jgi:hypothetical protein
LASLDPELLEPEEESELELPVLLAVGVDEVEVSVLVEPELPVVDEEEEEVLVEPDPEAVFVALGTVAATASEPARPLAATIAVIVAVRALPCRTERAAASSSMALLRQGLLSIRDSNSARDG